MSLGLLAKDSIQDLTALDEGGDLAVQNGNGNNGGSDHTSGSGGSNGSSRGRSSKLPHAPIPGAVAAVVLPADDVVDDDEAQSLTPPTPASGAGAGAAAGGYANPQQAQEEDSAPGPGVGVGGAAQPQTSGGAGSNNPSYYSGFRSDYYNSGGGGNGNSNYRNNPSRRQQQPAQIKQRQFNRNQQYQHPNQQQYHQYHDYHGHHDDHLHDYTKGENAFNYFDYATAAGVDYLGERSRKKETGGFLDCIFPCIFASSRKLQQERQREMLEDQAAAAAAAMSMPQQKQKQVEAQQQQVDDPPDELYGSPSEDADAATGSAGSSPRQVRSQSRDEDEISTNSDLLGEKLSDKERQAVLARLGLAQPNAERREGEADLDDDDDQHRRRQQEEDLDRQLSDQQQQDLQETSERQRQQQALLQENSDRSDGSDVVKKSHHTPKGGLLNGIPTYDASPLVAACEEEEMQQRLREEEKQKKKPLRSILKSRSSIAASNSKDSSDPSSTTSSPRSKSNKKSDANMSAMAAKRRSLFPSYSAPPAKRRVDFHVSFAPMARVVTVKSKNDMEQSEKADVWWQKTDYEDFRKTGRIITKAMLEGGSEIWLAASASISPTSSSSPSSGGGGGSSSSSLKKSASSDGNVSSDDEAGAGKSDTKDGYAPGDKWWHKFGHSRRGLEHVVSIDEGRQRQQNVRNAIHAVLEEQLRQKRYRREDPEKLRIVSLNHTTWARDLSLAAGASDADAVRSSFSKDRKSREFYLLKLARTSPATTAATSNKRVPTFMQPAPAAAVSASPMIKGHKLDANTAAQIQFRREQTKKQVQAPPKPKKEEAPKEAAPSEISEPIKDAPPGHPHDGSPKDHEPTLAERARGFISPEEGNNVDMAAVLSGMGALPHEPPVAAALSSSL